MKTLLGPIPRNKIILCSADAGPNAQRNVPGSAAYFFPRAPWVGAVRNYAAALNSRFFVLTTGHGMVGPDEVIRPYDLHIDAYPDLVAEKWRSTIPNRLSKDTGSLILLYAGGCPRDAYIRLCRPIFCELGISLLTFGRPNMYDADKIEQCVEMLTSGTSLAEIGSILRLPDRLEFYFHADRLYGPLGMNRRHPFVALSQLASQEGYCWQMHCSTCGHADFRFAFRALLVGEHPDDPAWPVKRDSDVEYLKGRFGQSPSLGGWPPHEQWALSMLVKGADIKRMALNGPFPDWLGHLGLALRYTEQYERDHRVLTESLVPQLAEMVLPNSHASQLCEELLASRERVITWQQLGFFEYAMKPEYRRSRDVTQ